MEDNKLENRYLIPLISPGLIKASTSIQTVDKFLFERAENYFNKGFYLINSKHLSGIIEN